MTIATRIVRWRKSPLALCLGTTLALVPAPAFADPIVVDVAARWSHAQTHFSFAPQVSEFERIAIQDFGKDELDVSAAYSDRTSGTEVTIYLFHAGLADASVWHDRIVSAMGSGELGELNMREARTTIFTPPSGQTSAGIRTVAPLSGKSAKATGVAIYPFADWLLAIRATSHRLDAPALDARLAAFVEALSAPQAPIDAPPAYPILACDSALPQKPAKIYKPTMMDALLGASVDIPDKKSPYDKASLPLEKATWCRDPVSTRDYGVYRSNGTRKSYIVAVGDAGMTASVAPDTLSGVFRSDSANAFQMTVRTVDHAYAYPRFTGLPAVEQVIAQITKGQPISSATRGSPDRTLTLPSMSGVKGRD